MSTNHSWIDHIIDASVNNKFLVFILTAVLMLGAIWCVKQISLDAIPDLSDTQVIVYSKWDRSPDLIEDQVTYPIVSSLLGMPKIKAVRGYSDFGYSYVYAIFEDGTDLYWARSRVVEYLSKINGQLPDGVRTELGPDATGVGWVYQYALVDTTGQHDLSELRSFQDWSLRYHLQSLPGVAEVAPIGGFVKQYQVTVDPIKLRAFNITIEEVIEALRQGNDETGGRLIEMTGREYMIRGRGYAKSITDLENIAIRRDVNKAPVLIKHIGSIHLGPDIRRGIMDLDGKGDAVGGTIVMRHGENALKVIEGVKKRLKELESSLPQGVEIVTTYDRSELILKAINTLTHQLIKEMIIVALVILFFLWHFPSSIVPIITIPIAVLLSFIPFYMMGLTANIMSLAGIAISIGVLVDGAIIEVENAYKRLQQWIAGGKKGDYHTVRLNAVKEVGPAVFFSLLVIAVSFIPVFTLIDQEGRLFKPLAYAKTFTMAIAALLAVTLDPALRMLFTRMEPFSFKPAWLSRLFTSVAVGKYYPEEQHPVSKRLFKVYEPVCRLVLKHPIKTLVLTGMLGLSTLFPLMKMGHEFMPPLWEGHFLYMPTTMPGISVTEAQRLLQKQDQILKSFPEVERVFGKAGRLESATDPAPLSMMETVVLLKPKEEWRRVKGFLGIERPLTPKELEAKLDEALQIPGVTNAWTMPIKNRIDMLSTGVRTPIGIKVLGNDVQTIEHIGVEIESLLKGMKETRSVFAERTAGGYFLDFNLNREALARYGVSVESANRAIESAIGGEAVTTLIQGRERYNVNVRYPRELRDHPDALKEVLVRTSSGAMIPIANIADITIQSGPSMIRNENGMLAGYVYVDTPSSDIGGYVEAAKKLVNNHVQLPSGYSIVFSGQYENMLRVKERLKVILPLTIFIICVLLYWNTKSWTKTGIVLLAVPFSLIGAIWMLYALGYNMSIAVWVGMIALMGLDAETGIFMLLYLDLAYKHRQENGQMNNAHDLTEAIVEGAVKRIRPKLMTVATAIIGLLPIMFSFDIGADVTKRIAAPMIGGLVSSFALELLVYPVVYYLWKIKTINKKESTV